MAEGTLEKVWTHRRGRAPLLGREEEEGRAATGKALLQSVRMPKGLADGPLGAAKNPLAPLGEIRRFLCRIPVARHLLGGLRASGG